MKLLLTAFEPFNGEQINPTMKLLDLIPEEIESIEKLVLPVSYARAFPALQEKLLSAEFTDVLMMGQAGGRALVSMERVALNFRDSGVADEDGVTILETFIDPDSGAPPAILTRYPLRAWYDEGKSLGLPLEISNSAGAFICNSISFQLANFLRLQNSKINSLFLHVPYLPEQVTNKPTGTASLPLSQMLKCAEFVIGKISAKHW